MFYFTAQDNSSLGILFSVHKTPTQTAGVLAYNAIISIHISEVFSLPVTLLAVTLADIPSAGKF